MAVVVVDALVVDATGGVTNGTLALPDTAAADVDASRVVLTSGVAVPLCGVSISESVLRVYIN